MKTKLDEQILNTMSKDPGNWKGPFYYNRKDPRLMVPKLDPTLGMDILLKQLNMDMLQVRLALKY